MSDLRDEDEDEDAAVASAVTYYKAIRPDGTSFHDPTFRWLPEAGPIEGHIVTHRLAKTQHVPARAEADRYLSVSVEPADCAGVRWPCRMLEVEPVDGYPVTNPEPMSLPHKCAARAWRIVRELPAHMALGPQGEHVAALLDQAGRLTAGEFERMDAAAAESTAWSTAWYAARSAVWDAAWYAARSAARYAASDAAMSTARYAAMSTARDVATALVVRDLISTEHYDTLTLPWRQTIGRIHPDDPED